MRAYQQETVSKFQLQLMFVAEAKRAKDSKPLVFSKGREPIEARVCIRKRDVKQAKPTAKAHAESRKRMDGFQGRGKRSNRGQLTNQREA